MISNYLELIEKDIATNNFSSSLITNLETATIFIEESHYNILLCMEERIIEVIINLFS